MSYQGVSNMKQFTSVFLCSQFRKKPGASFECPSFRYCSNIGSIFFG